MNANRRSSCAMTWFTVGALVLVFSLRSDANGFRNPPEGAAALGRGGGKVALTDDASSISHNPAALTGLSEPQAEAALTILRSKADFESPLGLTDETEDPWKLLPNLYAAWPFEEQGIVAGIGVTTPFGQSTEWDKDGIFRYSAPYFAELRVVDVNPTIALKLNDKLSLGLGADVYVSDFTLKQVYRWSAATGVAAAPDGEARFEADGQGFGINAGLLWQMGDRHSLALTYRSAVSVDLDGDFEISGIPPGFPAAPRSDFETEIDFPAVVALGYGFQPSEKLRIGADVEWVGFSDYESLPLDAGVNTLLLPAPLVPQNWDDIWTFGVGADYQLSDEWALRAGYIFLESPIPDETFSPTLPDADRHVLSVGLGYERGAHSVDVAYALSLFEDRDIQGNSNPAYDGEYCIKSQLMGISYAYAF